MTPGRGFAVGQKAHNLGRDFLFPSMVQQMTGTGQFEQFNIGAQAKSDAAL